MEPKGVMLIRTTLILNFPSPSKAAGLDLLAPTVGFKTVNHEIPGIANLNPDP